MEIWLGWPRGIKCWQTMLQGNVFYDIPLRQHVWFYYFKNKISEAKLLKSHTCLKDRISNHGKTCSHYEKSVFTLNSRNLHWNYCRFPPVQHKPCIHLPGFCLFISSISAIQMGKSTCDSVCVWFGAADGCEWQTVACVGTYLEITRSPASVWWCSVPMPLSKRALSGLPCWSFT